MDSPVFPAELEREIFETAALLDSRAIPSLLRVARRVLEWIEPLLYRVVMIGHSSRKDEAYHRALELKPAVLAKGVQHLFVVTGFSKWPEEDTRLLLRLCAPQLLSLWSSSAFYSPEILPILLHAIRLQRWAGDLEDLFGDHSDVDLRISAFRTITHMDIFDDLTDENEAAICAGLAALPCLTHLCLNDTRRLDLIPRILTQCPHLQVLGLMDPDEEIVTEIADDPPTTDVRFVVSVIEDAWQDWEIGAQGGTDFWAADDDFVARKRRGEIDGGFFHVEMDLHQ